MKLGLGTAQFGSDYGISNVHGKVPAATVERILRKAADNKLKVLDTAAAYGDSETVLGQCLWRDHPFRLVTKTLPVNSDRITGENVTAIRTAFYRSLERLCTTSVYGLLVHHSSCLRTPGGDAIAAAMLDLKREGLVTRIGASFYTSGEIEETLKLFKPDLVQVPVSVLDQRLIQDGTLAKLRNGGAEVHARSVFLQGLLLMNPDVLPQEMKEFQPELRKFSDRATLLGISRVALALGFVCGLGDVDVALAGVTCVTELEEALSAAAQDLESDALRDLASTKENLLNPSRWPIRVN